MAVAVIMSAFALVVSVSGLALGSSRPRWTRDQGSWWIGHSIGAHEGNYQFFQAVRRQYRCAHMSEYRSEPADRLDQQWRHFGVHVHMEHRLGRRDKTVACNSIRRVHFRKLSLGWSRLRIGCDEDFPYHREPCIGHRRLHERRGHLHLHAERRGYAPRMTSEFPQWIRAVGCPRGSADHDESTVLLRCRLSGRGSRRRAGPLPRRRAEGGERRMPLPGRAGGRVEGRQADRRSGLDGGSRLVRGQHRAAPVRLPLGERAGIGATTNGGFVPTSDLAGSELSDGGEADLSIVYARGRWEIWEDNMILVGYYPESLWQSSCRRGSARCWCSGTGAADRGRDGGGARLAGGHGQVGRVARAAAPAGARRRLAEHRTTAERGTSMNTDVEDLLRDGMERFTTEVHAPVGLACRAGAAAPAAPAARRPAPRWRAAAAAIAAGVTFAATDGSPGERRGGGPHGRVCDQAGRERAGEREPGLRRPVRRPDWGTTSPGHTAGETGWRRSSR